MTTPKSAGALDLAGAQESFCRQVFFIAGYDPRGPIGYYNRFRTSLDELSTRDGCEYWVGELEKREGVSTRWTFGGRTPAGETRTTFEFLHWDDIVAAHWRSLGRIGAQFAAMRTLWVYQRAGVMTRLPKVARAAHLALLVLGLAPLAMAFATLVVTALAALIGALVAHALGNSLLWGVCAAAPAFVIALFFWDRAWRELNLEWLARGYACVIETALGEIRGWNDRCDDFAACIAVAARQESADEIVVLGHSLGSIIAVTTLARWLEGRGGHVQKQKIAFATLGEILPFYTLIEKDGQARRDVVEVAASDSIDWVDVTSGSDPASACRLSPLVGAEAGACKVPRWDPEFHRILTPDHYRHIRRRPLDFHFQYLKSADRAGGFDLIRMMCSPAPFFADAPR